MNNELLKFLDNNADYISIFEKDNEKQLKEEFKKELFLQSCGLASVYGHTGDYKSIYKVVTDRLMEAGNIKQVFYILEITLMQLKNEHNRLFEDNNVYNKLRDYGIELANFENYYEILLIKLVSCLSGKEKEEVEWWLYEDVKKIYYVGEKEYNVEQPKDFLCF